MPLYVCMKCEFENPQNHVRVLISLLLDDDDGGGLLPALSCDRIHNVAGRLRKV